jgi:hypothetical protein
MSVREYLQTRRFSSTYTVTFNALWIVYIATADLIKLAERDETIRKAIALYLADKVKNGTPRQREIAEKILRRYPFFYLKVVIAIH